MRTAANRAWVARPSERSRAVKTIREGLRDAGSIPGALAAAEVVAAFGRLERMQLAGEIARLRALVLRKSGLVKAALAGFDFSALNAAAVEFGIAAPDLLEGGGKAKRARQRVLRALAVRDQADLMLSGAEVLLSRRPEVDEEVQLELDEFDGVVQPRLFQAIPLNEARLAMLDDVAPARRARLWWYAHGADLAPVALDALAQAAEVIHCFPEAATELEELRQAQGAIENLAREAARCREMRQAQASRPAVLVEEEEHALEAQPQTATQSRLGGHGRRR
jgi:hypothetical protein